MLRTRVHIFIFRFQWAWLLWLTLTHLAVGQTLTAFRSPRLAERFTVHSASFGPGRSATDGDGGLLFWFQNLDWVNGQQVGAPIKLREADGSIDPSFRPRAHAFQVQAVASLPDGSCFICAYRDGGAAVERLLPNGRPDSFFEPRLFSQGVRFLTPTADGGVLLTVFGNSEPNPHPQAVPVPNPTLIRLKRDGTVDSAFKAPEFVGGQLFVPPVFDSGGRIYVGGSFTVGTGPQWRNLVRLKPDGAIDPTFAGASTLPASLGGVIRGVGLQSDGKVVVVGDIRLPATLLAGAPPTNRFVALRFSAAGAYDPTFALVSRDALPTADFPRMLVVQPTDKLVVAATGLKRLNADGTVDTSFKRYDSPGANFWVHQFSDGRLLLPGLEPGAGAQIFLADGTPDPTFAVEGFGATVVPTGTALLTDGRVALGGVFNRVGGAERNSLAVLDGATGEFLPGQLDPARELPGAVFGSGADPEMDLAPGTGGAFYMSGNFVDPAGEGIFNSVSRVKPDGTEDDAFAADFNEIWGQRRIFAAADGGVWVIRNYHQMVLIHEARPAGSTARWPGLSLLDASGKLAAGFQGLSAEWGHQLGSVVRDPVTGQVTKVELGGLHVLTGLRSGGLLVALETWDGKVWVKRLNADGSVDAGFNGPQFPGGAPFTNSRQILDPVSNTRYQPVNGIVTHDSQRVLDATELPDGSVVISGSFALNGGLALLNSDGSVNPTFQPGERTYTRRPFTRPRVLSVAGDRYGRIYVAGLFDTFGGVATTGLAQLDRAGQVVGSFSNPLELLDYPRATAKLAVQGDLLHAFGTFRLPAEDFPRPAWKLTLPPPPAPPDLMAVALTGDVLTLAVPCEGACPDLGGWTLEGSADLTEWLSAGVSPVSANGRLEYAVPTAAAAKFYRLRQP